MNTNVHISATKKEFKNGTNGYEVKIEGMDGKLDCKMSFHDPLKSMRYMFTLAKKLNLQIDMIDLAALSLDYQRAKEAEQKAANDAATAIAELSESEKDDDSVSPEGENADTAAPAEPKSTPMLKQFNDLKKKHPDALLLFRCGDFYETYEQDAVDASKILGITLTKNSKTGISMAGFPYHALDTYLPKLIRAGKRVAICDQIEGADSKKPTKKGITELVSPKEEPAA